MRKVTKMLMLEESSKEVQKRAGDKFIETDDNGIILIAKVLENWLKNTKEEILRNPRNFRGYVKEYQMMLEAFSNILEYIEHINNYKLGYAYRMIENELIRIDYISEYELVVRVG